MKASTVGKRVAGGSTQRFGVSGTTDLNHLKQRFAAFRAEHRPRTRIPVTLREAVLGALDDGVDRAELRRACGVSSGQLDQWQRLRGRVPAREEGCQPVARVFSVEEDSRASTLESSDGAMAPALELRVGGWSVAIRPVATTPKGVFSP